MTFSPLIDQLIDALKCLPGVGPKTAQRMALYLLERNRQGGAAIAHAIEQAIKQVGHCCDCRTLTERERCNICSNERRDKSILCVVQTPTDVLALEQTGSFKGLYFVLMGYLSPIDGIGPEDIGISALVDRVKQDEVKEVILATNPTVEGEATAHYIAQQLKGLNVVISRIAHGVPLGGELEFVDGGTLTHALSGRKVIS